ncbi:predicted ATPase (plasmid) [Geminocystis sp. NIES-3708]|uniref:ATP-binding protein n=1 Tax=Geminocystis sp. NIES-3708 TaxID=1615909 RepID=UPI0005FCD6D2|nr:DUF499 domain-containing protein [Geminocystis sp. NIES-3708]BAQ63189.1 predicted ATPase [Geminocystis sp. NIES-3708]
MKPWYQIDGLTPRADLREGKPLDAAEFAVHLDQVRDDRAPEDYQNPEVFFERTYLTKYLTDLAAQVIRRLTGKKTGTSAIFNLSTQFGGGKTHTLTLLYHLAQNGSKADKWTGVNKILNQAEINSVPEAAVAVFVGTEFDSIRGRGGDDGTPLRKTPWGEIAYQLGGEEAFEKVSIHEAEFTEPKGDVIRSFLPQDKPCLILMDEIINYVSTYRHKGYHNKLYNFIQALSETARGLDNVVLVISIPASEMEYTADDEGDEQRLKKMLDRLGKAVIMSAESETSEIIRRRLFEWEERAVTSDGKIMLPKEAIASCNEYAHWVLEHRQSLPSWFPVDNAKEAFQATYPFHPSVLSVFERKWQVLPRFQRTRGVLRLLALWVANAYQEGYKGNHRDSLISLGTAPLDDPMFRTAVLEQLGENRLEGAITTDICGKNDAHALRLDKEAPKELKKVRLHSKVATTIFFESNGGQARGEATIPEIRLAVGEPDFDIANVETALDALNSQSYYLLINQNKYRYNISPNLNKILADRKANIAENRISELIKDQIEKIFKNANNNNLNLIFFPKNSNNIPNQPLLNLVILSPDYYYSLPETTNLINTLIQESGNSSRTYKSCLLFAVADDNSPLSLEARKVLAWQDIREQETDLNDEQTKSLKENLLLAERDLKEAVWRTYNYLALLGRDNQLQFIDLGQVNSSQASSLVQLFVNRLKANGEIENEIAPRFLVRNWSPAFKEWSTKNIRDAFYASPRFPRLLNPHAVKESIARGIREGYFAYVAKTKDDKYQPFEYKNSNFQGKDVEIADDVYIIKAEEAENYLIRITEPPKLKKLVISPAQIKLEPETAYSFKVEGFDQYEESFPVNNVTWTSTGGEINEQGVLQTKNDIGTFIITASVNEVTGEANFSVVKPSSSATENTNSVKEKTTNNYGEDEESIEKENLPEGVTWQGEITPQKWMQFYTKVLSGFATDKQLSLKLEVQFEITGDIPEGKVNNLNVALQELGLPPARDL